MTTTNNRRRLPELSSLVYLPIDQVDYANVTKQLTVDVLYEPGDDEYEDGEHVKRLELFDRSLKGKIGIPRNYFRKHIGGPCLIRTARPNYDPSAYSRRVTPRNQQQADFIANIAKLLTDPNPLEAQAIAATGSGKTASTIGAIAQTGIWPVMIGVHRNSLKNQWWGADTDERKEGFVYFMGEEWTRENVGIIQQDRCDFRGKKVIIAMMPSVVRRVYPQELYDYVSAVFIDEVHNCGAPVLSDFLRIFKPHHLIGLTATEKEGPGRKIIRAHIGPPAIVSTQETLKPKVYRIETHAHVRFYKEGQADLKTILTPLTRLPWRQDLLARLIMRRGVNRKRNVLLLSDRVEQLQNLRDRLCEMGMDPESFGLFVGEYETGKWKPSAKGVDAKGKRRMLRSNERFDTRAQAKRFAFDWAKGLGLRNVEFSGKPESIKPDEAYYDEIKGNPKYTVIGATYGIFGDGLNVPRIDMGVECTPRGNVKQPIGRIVRDFPGKPTPEWYSIWDKLYYIESIPVPGRSKPLEEQKYYGELKKLEKQRRKSYAFHKAKLIGIKDVQDLYR